MTRARPEDEFWKRIDQRGSDECWIWLRAKNSRGYGQVWIDLGDGKRQYGAHVVAHFFTHGVVSSLDVGSVIRHKCDNPPCCNPNHLEIGTTQENAMDMVSRGRCNTRNRAHGERLPFSRLTAAQVREIRASYRSQSVSFRLLARKYGVGKTTIEHIITGKTWNHVDA